MDKSFHRVWPNIKIQRSYCFCGRDIHVHCCDDTFARRNLPFLKYLTGGSNINISNSFVNDGLRSMDSLFLSAFCLSVEDVTNIGYYL